MTAPLYYNGRPGEVPNARKVSEYLGRFASSRVVYRELYAEAAALLRPVSAPVHGLERIESFRSRSALAKATGLSPTTVGAELRRLENAGWIQAVAPEPRRNTGLWLLGHREGAFAFLFADDRAETATGCRAIVSRYVLAGHVEAAPTQPEAPGEAREAPAARGTRREWKAPEVKS